MLCAPAPTMQHHLYFALHSPLKHNGKLSIHTTFKACAGSIVSNDRRTVWLPLCAPL